MVLMATPGITTSPLFDGAASGYKEWRKRITIYYRKMSLAKKQGEAVLNLLGALTGTAWKLVEHFDLDTAEDADSFQKRLGALDMSFQYDAKTELPSDFAAYFEYQGRRSGQTILQYITEMDERLRKLEKHGVQLPTEVQGWHILSKAHLSREQKANDHDPGRLIGAEKDSGCAVLHPGPRLQDHL